MNILGAIKPLTFLMLFFNKKNKKIKKGFKMEANNISTIATWTAICVMIIEIILKHLGIEIPHDTVVMFVTGVITFIIAIWSSRNPNTLDFLGNAPNPVDTEETVLNDEYECDEDGC